MEALVYFVLPVILLILGLPVFVVFDRDMHEVARFIETAKELQPEVGRMADELRKRLVSCAIGVGVVRLWHGRGRKRIRHRARGCGLDYVGIVLLGQRKTGYDPRVSIIECIPNVSEGRRTDVITRLTDALRTTPGVHLLDVSSDADHNRSVFTMVGSADALQAGLLRLFDVAVAHIDLRTHQGVHPRMGAVDVVPFVPLLGSRFDDAVAARDDFATQRRFVETMQRDIARIDLFRRTITTQEKMIARLQEIGYAAYPAGAREFAKFNVDEVGRWRDAIATTLSAMTSVSASTQPRSLLAKSLST